MTIISTSAIHRTACLGVGFLMGAAVLAACGESPDQVATLAPVDAKVAPAAPYVSPEQSDRAAMLAVRRREGIRGRPLPSSHSQGGAEGVRVPGAGRQGRHAGSAGPEGLRRCHRAACNGVRELRAQRRPRPGHRSRRAAAVSAHASADAIEHQALGQSTSAHRSADAVERWALSSTDG